MAETSTVMQGAGLIALRTIIESLDRIEFLLWLLVALLGAITLLLFLRLPKESSSETEPSWRQEVEKAYDRADYETALDILDTASLLCPGSALVEYWRGRCYFQQENWAKAASTFEALVRSEPIYRRSIKDYMAFIELNELVDGVEGYLDARDD